MVRGSGEHRGVGDDSAEMSNHLKLKYFCALMYVMYDV